MNSSTTQCRYHLGAEYGPQCQLIDGHAGPHNYDGQLTATDEVTVHAQSYPTTRDLRVRIEDYGLDGSRRDKVPSIMVEEYPGSWQVHLTWNEARALAKALTEITDLAEFG